jgi:hypothetical protein
LQNLRKIAIEAVLLDIDELAELKIQQLAQGYEQLDAHGQHTPFCAAIAYLLQNYFCNFSAIFPD